jgi:hypothetical protein
MRENRLPPVPAPASDAGVPTARLHQLQLIAASRVSACRTTSRQQVTDIVRVTVDDEVDTSTFRAIVDAVAPTTLH